MCSDMFSLPVSHGLRNELQREKKAVSQARSILWLADFPERSISPEGEDEIKQEGRDNKQASEDKIGEARRFEDNDDRPQNKIKMSEI